MVRARPAKRGPGVSTPTDRPNASCGFEMVLSGASELHPVQSAPAATVVRGTSSHETPTPRRSGTRPVASALSRRVNVTDSPRRAETATATRSNGRIVAPSEYALPEKRMSADWPYGLNSVLVVVV